MALQQVGVAAKVRVAAQAGLAAQVAGRVAEHAGDKAPICAGCAPASALDIGPGQQQMRRGDSHTWHNSRRRHCLVGALSYGGLAVSLPSLSSLSFFVLG